MADNVGPDQKQGWRWGIAFSYEKFLWYEYCYKQGLLYWFLKIQLPYFFGHKFEVFQNNPKNTDLSCEMDLDFWYHPRLFQGKQLCPFTLASLDSGGQLLKERIFSLRSKFFPLK